MKKVFIALFIALAIAVVLAELYAGRSITITVPSDANGPIVPGHGFFITGTIAGTLPSGVSLRVSVLDSQDKEVRFAEAAKKDYDVIDRFCDAFFYYYEDDPERLSVRAREFPCLIVDDSGKGLRNANIKCWFSDEEFNAFIPYATDAEHGLIFDDGIGYTDAQGISYDALPDGEYTAYVVLRDKGGRELASQKKAFSIRPAENAIICRFFPDEQYKRMMRFAAENKLSMAVDLKTGYYPDPSGNASGGLRAMFIGADVALYRHAHVHMFDYLIREKSITYTVELTYVEKYLNVDDPERFTVWRYDIGEPVIHVNGRTLEGAILRVDSGDKLCLCRADLTVHGTEGFLDLSQEILSTDTDFSDGVTLKASGDCRIAFAGLVVPHQLKDDEIVFDLANNIMGLLNRVENIVYTIWDGTKTTRITKPVKMIRKFADGWTDDSVMEFYHVFERDEIDPDGNYSVTLYGIDKNGVRVDGTTESFIINHAPARNI